jgi:DNA-binding XRE family transcriptional regulator
MTAKRIHRKIQRTPEDKVRLRALRERFQRERPTPEALVASGEYEPPIPQGAVLDMMRDLARLKEERLAAGLTLAEVAERSGIDKSALSRLEHGQQVNPTYETLWRYAAAIGKRMLLAFQDPAKPSAS